MTPFNRALPTTTALPLARTRRRHRAHQPRVADAQARERQREVARRAPLAAASRRRVAQAGGRLGGERRQERRVAAVPRRRERGRDAGELPQREALERAGATGRKRGRDAVPAVRQHAADAPGAVAKDAAAAAARAGSVPRQALQHLPRLVGCAVLAGTVCSACRCFCCCSCCCRTRTRSLVGCGGGSHDCGTPPRWRCR